MKNYNPDILNCLANLSSDEVFTPPNIATKMLDLLPQELFSNPNAKFLDPFSKSGVFLREIAKRLLKGLESQIPDLQERIDHIMHHQLYGIGITELTAYMSRRSLYCTARANSKHSVTHFPDEDGNIFFEEISHTWDKNRKCTYCGVNEKDFGDEQREGLSKYAYPFIHNLNPYEDMNFDVIIGNPPYQVGDGGGTGSSAIPIYHKFIQSAMKMTPRYLCMIVPSRWFSGGRGLDDFREEMLSDRRLKEIHDYPDASDIFPGVSVEGGINYFLWEKDYEGDCLIKTYEKGEYISEMKRPLKEEVLDTLIRYNEAIRKVQAQQEKSFSELVSSRKPFGFDSKIKGKKETFQDAVKIYVTKGIGYVKREEVPQNEHWIDAHKVYIGKAYGMGKSAPYKVINNPIYGEPNTCCSETYLVIGPFRDNDRCDNVTTYKDPRFFRFLVLLKKPTQNTAKNTYLFVPQQKFDQPWTDAELYEKYSLTEEEIAYIESLVSDKKEE